MPITVHEKPAGRKQRRSSNSTAEIGYLIFGTTDEHLAGVALQSVVPPIYQGLVLDSIEAELISTSDAIGGICEGRVTYCTAEKKEQKDQQNQQQEAGDAPTFNFSVSGGTVHIERSLETVYAKTVLGADAPSFKGLIGVQDPTQPPAGHDVDDVEFEWTEQHFLPPAAVTTAYINTLIGLYGRTNLAPFRGRPADTVKYMGTTGSKRGDKDWDLTFRFVAKDHETIFLQEFSEAVPKNAFDVLWTTTVPILDQDSEGKVYLVRRDGAVYVERVCSRGDFSELGIGTAELIL